MKQKTISNKIKAVYKTPCSLAEEAVSAVLKSEQEIKEGKVLKGDIRKLIYKILM